MPTSANCPKKPSDIRADVGIRAPILPLSQQPLTNHGEEWKKHDTILLFTDVVGAARLADNRTFGILAASLTRNGAMNCRF